MIFDTENNFPINFRPMPKRFMVWDGNIFLKLQDAYPKIAFQTEKMKKEMVYEVNDLIALSEIADMSYFELVQSTNLFDKDGKEIFEGSIVRDFDDAIGVVYYDLEDGEYRAKIADGDSFELAESSYDLKVLGHILSNPELLEEK